MLPRITLLLSAALLATACHGQDTTPAAAVPPKPKLLVYLLMGQSNMAGRGKVVPEERQSDPRVLSFDKDHRWIIAADPLHWDKPKIAGVGPGLGFGIQMAKAKPDYSIGLVPCAVGGTPLSRWEKGGDLYAAALARATAAAKTGTLAGVLWHQGESDSNPEKAATYLARLTKMIADFRADLNLPNLPFVLGELGEFHLAKAGAPAVQVNDALKQAASSIPNVAVASSAGLVDGGDHLHFDAASQREFGRRYAEAMVKLSP